MEGVFRQALVKEVERQGATNRIEVVCNAQADEWIKVPPQHLITDKAARFIKSKLAREAAAVDNDASSRTNFQHK